MDPPAGGRLNAKMPPGILKFHQPCSRRRPGDRRTVFRVARVSGGAAHQPAANALIPPETSAESVTRKERDNERLQHIESAPSTRTRGDKLESVFRHQMWLGSIF